METKILGSDFLEPLKITDSEITIKKEDYFAVIKLMRNLMGPLGDPVVIDGVSIVQPRTTRLDFGDSKCSSCGQ